ncbi:C-C motif chemokine 7-like [Rhinoderma darwinii]|uniref:C-C motif chemokine 7-like n=1 Tax=Rhinoderma darwinii TaxID=43563 RepID=UPI003F66C49C
MRVACLAVFVILILQVTCTIYSQSKISACCTFGLNSHLKSKNIKSYKRTNDTACQLKAFIVERKKGSPVCADATSEKVLLAINDFDKKTLLMKFKKQ